MSIRLKVILSITLVFVLGGFALSLFLKQDYEQHVRDAAQTSIARDSAVFAQLEADDTAKLSAANLSLQQNDKYRTAFVAEDRDALLALATPVFEQLKSEFDITHLYFERPGDEGTVFLRVHKPAQFDDALKRKTYLQAVESAKPAAGLELGATAVALRVVRPYYSEDGKSLIGYTELGQEIDGFLGTIKEQTGDDVGLLLAKQSMDASAWAAMREAAGLENNWDDQSDYVLAASTNEKYADEMKFDGAIDSVPEEGKVVGTFEEEGRTEVRGVFPVKDAAGSAVGVVFVEHDITETAAMARQGILKVLAAVIVMLIAVLGIVIVLMNTLVFGRLDKMIAGMEDISTRLAGGDFSVSYAGDETRDEIGEFERFFAQFISMTASALRSLSEEVRAS